MANNNKKDKPESMVNYSSYTYTCVSHIHRCKDLSFRIKPKIDFIIHKVFREVEKLLSDGVVVRKTELVTDDTSNKMSLYRVNDFSLNNLISTGAIANCSSCHLVHNQLHSADSAIQQINNLKL